jgi:RNA polymerase-binding transcription factor DksA
MTMTSTHLAGRRPDLVTHLGGLRKRLEAERRGLADQLSALRRRRPFTIGPSPDEEARAWAARRRLGDVETALNRIRTHRYGRCLHCGVDIPIERLRLCPAADACAACEPR